MTLHGRHALGVGDTCLKEASWPTLILYHKLQLLCCCWGCTQEEWVIPLGIWIKKLKKTTHQNIPLYTLQIFHLLCFRGDKVIGFYTIITRMQGRVTSRPSKSLAWGQAQALTNWSCCFYKSLFFGCFEEVTGTGVVGRACSIDRQVPLPVPVRIPRQLELYWHIYGPP